MYVSVSSELSIVLIVNPLLRLFTKKIGVGLLFIWLTPNKDCSFFNTKLSLRKVQVFRLKTLKSRLQTIPLCISYHESSLTFCLPFMVCSHQSDLSRHSMLRKSGCPSSSIVVDSLTVLSSFLRSFAPVPTPRSILSRKGTRPSLLTNF